MINLPDKYKKLWDTLSPDAKRALSQEIQSNLKKIGDWPTEYRSKSSGKIYKPHNSEEAQFVYDDSPRYMLLKGGEGGGKSVAGFIKDLERLRRGMDVIMVSPDFTHFKKSLWPVILDWIPWDRVLDRHRAVMQQPGWFPGESGFEIWFNSQYSTFSRLICGGVKESEIGSWEGPNVSAAHFDEARRHRTPVALKVLDGRIRIDGQDGTPPQLYFTTTPRKHWLFDYFGPIRDKDPHKDFKEKAFVATIRTEENKENLSENFHKDRALSFETEVEARIHLNAEWLDEESSEKFINLFWWDACQDSNIPPMSPNDTMIIALDANKGGKTTLPDMFACVGGTRDPRNPERAIIRYVNAWEAQPGQLMDFSEPKEEIKRLFKEFSVLECAYDPYQLHDTCQTMMRDGIGLFKEFDQNIAIQYANSRLQKAIAERRILHDGTHDLLREHMDNADMVKTDRGLKLLKRSNSLKIDLVLVTSMMLDRLFYYNL